MERAREKEEKSGDRKAEEDEIDLNGEVKGKLTLAGPNLSKGDEDAIQRVQISEWG